MLKSTTRRDVLLGLAGSAAFAACTGRPTRNADAAATTTVPAPDEPRICQPSADNIEGPFFKAGAPERVDLTDGKQGGEPLVVQGRVLDTRCRPISGARLEIWQADHHGEYDTDGDRFRATLALAEDGLYRFETILPGRYLNGQQYRPAHIHAKVHAPGHRSLTTQLYFEGDPFNDADPFIESSLIMARRRGGDGEGSACRFDFVLQSAKAL